MKPIRITVPLAVVVAMLVSAFAATAVWSDENAPKSGENIKWQVISGGGTSGSSTNYQLNGTIGQTAAGAGTSTNYVLNHGYWQDFREDILCVPGDANESGAVDIDDVVYVIAFIFSGGPVPTPGLCCADANGSGGTAPVDIDDVVYLIAYIFSGGLAPVPAC